MVRFSTAVFIALNCFSLLLGFTAVSCAAYIQVHGGTVCQKALEFPLLIVGLTLLIVSLLGLVGSCCKANVVLCFYLVLMFFLIIGLVVFTFFVLFVTNKFVGRRVSPNRLQDYSFWLQKHVEGRNWEEIKSCLNDAKACNNLNDLEIRDWSLLQSGCCKPPMYCGLHRKNATFWVVPKGGPAAPDNDCTTFSNHQMTLCYDCQSCKRGVIAEIRKEWRALAVFNLCVVAISSIMFSIGCCVRKNNRYDQYVRYSAYS